MTLRNEGLFEQSPGDGSNAVPHLLGTISITIRSQAYANLFHPLPD